MSQNKSPSLEELEAEVRALTFKKHKGEIALMVGLMQLYIDGFNLIDSFVVTEDNDIQQAWLRLLTHAFRSMRSALMTMHIGYYGEALSLLRIATEDWFAAEHCEKNSTTLTALLHDEGLKLNWENMAQNIGALKIVYEGDYHYLSRFTHVCKLSLAVLIDPERKELRITPIYDELLFLSCCEMFFRTASRIAAIMLKFLKKQVEFKSDSWLMKAEPIMKQAGNWLRERRKEYGNQELHS